MSQTEIKPKAKKRATKKEVQTEISTTPEVVVKHINTLIKDVDENIAFPRHSQIKVGNLSLKRQSIPSDKSVRFSFYIDSDDNLSISSIALAKGVLPDELVRSLITTYINTHKKGS